MTTAAAAAAAAAHNQRLEGFLSVIAESTTADQKSHTHFTANMAKVLSEYTAGWQHIVDTVAGGGWLKRLCSAPEKLKKMLNIFNASSNASLIGWEFEAVFVQVMRDVITQSWFSTTADDRAAGAIARHILTATANMSEVAARAVIDDACVAGGARSCDRVFVLVWDRLLVLYVAAHTHTLASTWCPTDRSGVPDARWRELFACVFRIANTVCNAVDVDQLKAAYVSLYTALMAERTLWFALNAVAAVPGTWVQLAGPVPPNSAAAGNRQGRATGAGTSTRAQTPSGPRATRVPCYKCIKAGQIDAVARSHDHDQCIAVNPDNTPRTKQEIRDALKIRDAKKK